MAITEKYSTVPGFYSHTVQYLVITGTDGHQGELNIEAGRTGGQGLGRSPTR